MSKKRKVSPTVTINVDETIPKSPLKPRKRVISHVLLWKKRYSLGFILLITVVIAVLLYFVLSSQVHFVLNNEIVISHDPRLGEQTVTRGDTISINVSIRVEPYKRCVSACETQIVNLFNNKTSTFTHNTSGEFGTQIETPSKGFGHFFVQVKTSCVNTKTFFCPSSQKPFIESSLYAMTYALNDVERGIISDESLKTVVLDLHEAQTIQQITPSQFQSVNLTPTIESILNGVSSWYSQDYTLAQSYLSKSIPLTQIRDDYENYTTSISSYNNITTQLLLQRENLTNLFDAQNTLEPLFSELRSIEEQHLMNAQTIVANSSLITESYGIITQIAALDNANEELLQSALLFYQNQTNITLTTCDDLANFTTIHCTLQNYTVSFIPYLVAQTISNETIAKQELVQPKPVCCQEGICTACAEQHIPILFIHGHAFNKDNTPDNQMSSFAKLQSELPFTNGGIIDLQQKYGVSRGAYGNSINPLTFRGSYYYIDALDLGDFSVSVQKSERIENYALRLRELVEAVKYLTGAPRIKIVAHSMGGLVAREYINIFGDESIEKLITINSPHGGISGRTAKTCDWFGASKECEDMTVGSVFLKRIEDIKNVYVIHSTGCDMTDGEIGDGVVTKSSGYLTGANTNIVIEGNCTDTLGTSLHSDVLDPQLYPEIIPILTTLLT